MPCIVQNHAAVILRFRGVAEMSCLRRQDSARVPDKVDNSQVLKLPHETEERPERQPDDLEDAETGDLAGVPEPHKALEVVGQVEVRVVHHVPQAVAHLGAVTVQP